MASLLFINSPSYKKNFPSTNPSNYRLYYSFLDFNRGPYHNETKTSICMLKCVVLYHSMYKSQKDAYQMLARTENELELSAA